jgi:hypothetical protein
VEYLLISGQASILYGAATFSEDVDIWIRPTSANARRLLRALASCGARVHKPTPPLSLRHMRRGHGFHFIVPSSPEPIYLDVLARPPRVGRFEQARRRGQVMRTPWGLIPVVSIPDLVALKKTRRHSDYEVISNLVALRVWAEPGASPALLRWGVRHTFRAEDRVRWLRWLGKRASLRDCRDAIAGEMKFLQARDAAYWRRIIVDLKRLRRSGCLLEERVPVTKLLVPR